MSRGGIHSAFLTVTLESTGLRAYYEPRDAIAEGASRVCPPPLRGLAKCGISKRIGVPNPALCGVWLFWATSLGSCLAPPYLPGY
jgi:hypothetical protein